MQRIMRTSPDPVSHMGGRTLQEEAEEERQAMVQELEALQQAVADRENELLSVRQDLTDLEDRLPVRLRKAV